jgi:hypothetical protein
MKLVMTGFSCRVQLVIVYNPASRIIIKQERNKWYNYREKLGATDRDLEWANTKVCAINNSV